MILLKEFSLFLIGESYRILILYTAVCAVAFIVYAVDKYKALKGKWRISEKTLLTLSFFGGSAGALLAMHIFRHKTRDPVFRICVPLSLILHIISAAAVIYFGLYM